LYRTFLLFTSQDFEIRNNSTVAEILFIRRFKLFAIGAIDRLPEKMGDVDLVQVEIRRLATELSISRGKLRIKGVHVSVDLQLFPIQKMKIVHIL
jgi:hypothetical protein